VVVLLIYVGAGLAPTFELGGLPAGAARTSLQPAFIYVFVSERFLLTGLYCCIVFSHAPPTQPQGSGIASCRSL
jgi:hypothetical protein